jgi:hypothetical protein
MTYDENHQHQEGENPAPEQQTEVQGTPEVNADHTPEPSAVPDVQAAPDDQETPGDPLPVETWALQLSTPAWLFAAAKVGSNWPAGAELTQAEYKKALATAEGEVIG